MSIYKEPVVTVHLMVAGYRAALARFRDAAETGLYEVAYPPLFEVLEWAAALDERCQELWARGARLLVMAGHR
jgi:hypothetical protein